MNTEYSIGEKRISALDKVDSMTPAIRACVHEFGLPIVSTLMKFGVTSPANIREIVTEIWFGARQSGQKGGVMKSLDVILASGPISSEALMVMLEKGNRTIVPLFPTRAMLDASMKEVSGFNVHVTKEEKHKRRLIAAINAARASK